MTKVIHCKKEEYDIYIGRPSKWGNPFSTAHDSREICIKKYEQWLVTQTHLMSSLHELKGKTLGCWCKPLACHGDVLAELVNAS